MNNTQRYIVVLIGMLTISATHADIYQWQDSSGSIIFGNKPPSDNDTVAKVQQLKLLGNHSDKENTSNPTQIKFRYQSIAKIFHASKRQNLLYKEKSLSSESRIISVKLIKEQNNKTTFLRSMLPTTYKKVYKKVLVLMSFLIWITGRLRIHAP